MTIAYHIEILIDIAHTIALQLNKDIIRQSIQSFINTDIYNATTNPISHIIRILTSRNDLQVSPITAARHSLHSAVNQTHLLIYSQKCSKYSPTTCGIPEYHTHIHTYIRRLPRR